MVSLSSERFAYSRNAGRPLVKATKGNLQQHIFAQLKYELLNCKAAFRLCGMTGAPRGFQKSDIISLDIVSENSELHEQLLAA